MKRNLVHALSLVFFLAITSCEKSIDSPEIDLNNNLLKSSEKYHDLLSKREEGSGEFTIEGIKRKSNILTIQVKGGCSVEDFHIVWDGSVMFSNPGQVNLVLYNKSEENCGLEKQFDIHIDLNKIVGTLDPKDLIFNVANGSMKQDKSLNPNGSVTSK